MIYRYSSIAIMTLLTSASSLAASAVLPPLPSQQPPPVVQDSAKPPPPVSLPSAEPTPSAPPAAEKQNPSESLPSPDQPSTPSAPAPTQVSTPDAKKTSDSPQSSQDESESFMDTGQKQLPRIQHEDKSTDSGSYNPSDLRIPVIESAEKDAAKNSDQSNSQDSDSKPSDNAAVPAADAAQAAPTAPDISLPEATHPAQAAGSAAAIPPVSAQTPPQVPATASGAVTASPVVSAPPASTVIPVAPPVQTEAPPAMPASATDAAIPATVQTPPQAPLQPSAPAVADAAPAPIPVPAPPLVPAPAPDVQQPQPHAAVPAPAKQLTADQIKFINDEAIVFTLADDDVELGKITEAAEISQMPAYNYIKLFWKSYQTPLDKMHERDVDLFLSMLETPPSGAYSGAMNYDEASTQAFEAASEGKLSDLRVIISHYPVLQMRDGRGNNMLGSAIEADRLEIARFLLVRGIDLYATNYEGYDALAIARDENNDEAVDLLSRARFVGRR